MHQESREAGRPCLVKRLVGYRMKADGERVGPARETATENRMDRETHVFTFRSKTQMLQGGW